jgi:hypothetical protein
MEAICKKKRTVNLTTWPQFAPMSVAVLKQCVYLLAGATFLWIPGIVAMSAYDALAYSMYAHPTLMGVGVFWWSAWLSFCWASFWLAAAIAYVSPSLVRLALGAVSLAAVRLTIYLEVCRRYTTAVVWTLMAWSAYLSFVWTHFPGRETVDSSLLDPLSANSTVNATSSSTSTQSIIDALYGQGTATGTGTTSNAVAFLLNNNSNSASLISISRLLFGLVICSSLLLSEKLAIQAIANSFHAVTYSDRIALVKYHAGVLTKLYEQAKRQGTPSRVLRAEINAECLPLTSRKRDSWQSIRNVLSNFALPFKTVYGNGESIPFMPPAATVEQIVEATLENRKETMKLAHTIWSALSVEDAITIKQVMPAFSNEIQAARRAFNVLDRNRNGSLRYDELLYACLEIHNERITLLHSMSDIDFAVGKLDRILTTLWGTISLVILAALLSSRISTLLSSLGAILLGLSWLIASSAQEILASLIWVFAKHAIDVGDVITVPGLVSIASASATKDPIATLEGFNDGDTFVVEEVQLLSSILRLQSSGKQVQVSNALLSQRPLINLGRSGQLEEG